MSKSKKQVTGIADQLPLAIKTGKHICGYEQTIRSLVNQEAQVVVLTKNYPEDKKKEIEYLAYLADNTPVICFDGSNNDLSKLLDKHYRCGVISIIDKGEADMLAMANE